MARPSLPLSENTTGTPAPAFAVLTVGGDFAGPLRLANRTSGGTPMAQEQPNAAVVMLRMHGVGPRHERTLVVAQTRL